MRNKWGVLKGINLNSHLNDVIIVCCNSSLFANLDIFLLAVEPPVINIKGVFEDNGTSAVCIAVSERLVEHLLSP